MPKIELPTDWTNQQIQLIVNRLCSRYRYQATINGQQNPQSKAQFALQQIELIIRRELSDEKRRLDNIALEAADEL